MSKKYSLSKETGELRKLILENPDLPIVVLAGQDATGHIVAIFLSGFHGQYQGLQTF